MTHALSHLRRHAKTLFALGMMTPVLGACQSMGAHSTSGTALAPSPDAVTVLCSTTPAPSALMTATSSGDDEMAQASFLTALANDLSGHGVTARRYYADVVSGPVDMDIRIICPDGRVLANGAIKNIASRSLVRIAGDLRAHDVVMTPPRTLHAGLPAQDPDENTDGDGSTGEDGRYDPLREKPRLPAPPQTGSAARTAPATPVTVTTPPSASRSGTWFAHLTSYRTAEAAAAGVQALERQYPALQGLIDEWQVNVTGTVWRLGVTTVNWQDANTLCEEIRANGPYCRVLDRVQASTPGT